MPAGPGRSIPGHAQRRRRAHLGQHPVCADGIDAAGRGSNPPVEEHVVAAAGRRQAASGVEAKTRGTPVVAHLARRPAGMYCTACLPAQAPKLPMQAAHRCGNEALRKRKKSWGYALGLEPPFCPEEPAPTVTLPPSVAAVMGSPASRRAATRSMRRPLP